VGHLCFIASARLYRCVARHPVSKFAASPRSDSVSIGFQRASSGTPRQFGQFSSSRRDRWSRRAEVRGWNRRGRERERKREKEREKTKNALWSAPIGRMRRKIDFVTPSSCCDLSRQFRGPIIKAIGSPLTFPRTRPVLPISSGHDGVVGSAHARATCS